MLTKKSLHGPLARCPLLHARAACAMRTGMYPSSSLRHSQACATGAAAPPPSPVEAAAVGRRLTDWLQRKGGIVSGVAYHVDISPQGTIARELRATQDLEPGRCVVWVPQAATLRHDQAVDKRLRRLFECVPNGSDTGGRAWQFKQALLICWHLACGPASPFHSYLMALPGLAAGVPLPPVGMVLGASPELRDELQYPPMIQDVFNQHYWWQHFSAEVLDKLPGTDGDPFSGVHIDSQTFGWAVAMATSRCFGLRRSDAHVMVPIVDMIDHSVEPNCKMSTSECSPLGGADDAGGGSGGDAAGGDEDVGLFITRRVRAGEALSLRYGRHDNSALLLGYGFVVPGNPHDRLSMRYDVDLLASVVATFTGYDPRPLTEWKQRLLAGLAPGPASEAEGAPLGTADGQGLGAPASVETLGGADDVWLGGPQVVDPRLLATLRILLLQDDAQRLAESMTAAGLGDWLHPVARQHEILVLKALAGQCTALYSGFPTTIQQDRAILAAAAAEASAPAHVATTAAAAHAAARLNAGVPAPDVSAAPGGPAGWAPLVPGAASLGSGAEGTAAARLLAVRFRLELKQGLERTLLAVLARSKELQDLALPEKEAATLRVPSPTPR